MIHAWNEIAQEFCDEQALKMQEWDAEWVRLQNH